MRQIGGSKHSMANSILKSGALKSRPGALQQRNAKHRLQQRPDVGPRRHGPWPEAARATTSDLQGREEKRKGITTVGGVARWLGRRPVKAFGNYQIYINLARQCLTAVQMNAHDVQEHRRPRALLLPLPSSPQHSPVPTGFDSHHMTVSPINSGLDPPPMFSWLLEGLPAKSPLR